MTTGRLSKLMRYPTNRVDGELVFDVKNQLDTFSTRKCQLRNHHFTDALLAIGLHFKQVDACW
jgi:hypothetical protein